MNFPEGEWKNVLHEELEKEYFQTLKVFVENEYKEQVVYPPKELIFNAFKHCPFEQTKVVLIGQDPYHGEGQANGLCFSVNDGIKFPPSLRNIFKEIEAETSQPAPLFGSLERWADQGVLLLNATLTVRAKTPGSHQKKGWEQFTDAVIQKVSEQQEQLVFILWGAYAQKKGEMIDRSKHLVLESAHPSPFSAHKGFFGNQHFLKTNEFLRSVGKEEINW